MSHAPYETTESLRNQSIDIGHIIMKVGEITRERPAFIHIGGVSAAGKSTVGEQLALQLPGSRLFSIDSYLSERLWDNSRIFDHTPPDPERPYIGGISPEIWDFDLMEAHLAALRQNQKVEMPVFDETIKDRVGARTFLPGRYVIVEGGNSFSDRFIENSDYRILIKAPLHDCVTRKIVRTHKLYGRDDIDEVLIRYFTKDEPVRKIYDAEHTAKADQVIHNQANPALDYAYLEPASTAIPQGDRYRLLPKPEAGMLKDTENLGLIKDSSGAFYLRYDASGKTLVCLPIPDIVVGLMAEHYDIEED